LVAANVLLVAAAVAANWLLAGRVAKPDLVVATCLALFIALLGPRLHSRLIGYRGGGRRTWPGTIVFDVDQYFEVTIVFQITPGTEAPTSGYGPAIWMMRSSCSAPTPMSRSPPTTSPVLRQLPAPPAPIAKRGGA
jgi:hypothetical protein